MTIQTNVGASTRRPGTFFQFNIRAAQRGLAPLDIRIALIAQQAAAGSKTVGEVNQVFSDADADAFYGQGSELALMARFALAGGRAFSTAPQVWAIGMADVAGTASEQTFTVTGAATEAGEVVFRIAGRILRANVANGDSASDIAAEMNDRIAEASENLPITATVLAGVVTCVSVNTGENGNDAVYSVDDETPAGVTVVTASTVAGVGVADITASLDVLADKDYDFIAIANHTATDVSDFASHLDEMFEAGTKRWRHAMMAEIGTLATAQALATAADDFRQVVVSAEGFKNTPGEIAAYLAATMGGESDPALPFNNVELPDLALPDPADIPTIAELESGIGGGLYMLSVNEQQTNAKIIRAVTTKTTEQSVPFFALLDVTISRSMFFTARQVDIAEQLAFPRAKKTNRTKANLRSVVLDTLAALEDLEIVQNVDEHASELVVEDVEGSPDRLNVAIPTSIVPPLNQIVNVINLLVE